MKTIDELDRLHAAATAGPWEVLVTPESPFCEWCVVGPHYDDAFSDAGQSPCDDDTRDAIVALHNAWPAFSARLRAAEVEVERLRGALRGMLRAHPNCHAVDCGGYGCDDDCLTDDPDGDTGGDLHVCECGAITARNAARAALGEP